MSDSEDDLFSFTITKPKTIIIESSEPVSIIKRRKLRDIESGSESEIEVADETKPIEKIVSPVVTSIKSVDLEIQRKKQRLWAYDQERIKLLKLKESYDILINNTLNNDEHISDVEIDEKKEEEIIASNDEKRVLVAFIFHDVNKNEKVENLNILTNETWGNITKKLIDRLKCISLTLYFDGEKLNVNSTPEDSDISQDDRIDLKIIWPNIGDINLNNANNNISLQFIKLNIDYMDVFKQNRVFTVDVLPTNTWSVVIDKLHSNFKMDSVKLNYGGSPLSPKEQIEKSELTKDDHIYADIKWSGDTEVIFNVWAIDKIGKKIEFPCHVKFFKPWRDVNIQVAKILKCKVAAINFAGSEFDSSTTPAESTIASDSKLEAKIKK